MNDCAERFLYGFLERIDLSDRAMIPIWESANRGAWAAHGLNAFSMLASASDIFCCVRRRGLKSPLSHRQTVEALTPAFLSTAPVDECTLAARSRMS